MMKERATQEVSSDDLRIVRDSGYFDPAYYKDQVRINWQGLDAASHFLANWRVNLASPSPEFSLCRYLNAYPDVVTSGLNPLVHYIKYGREDHRRLYSVHEEFDKAKIFANLAYTETKLPRRSDKHKRIAIFAAFNENFIVEDYVIYYLEQLAEVVDHIIFVSDNYFPMTELLKIRHLVSIFQCKKHGEYDFGSYKAGLHLAWANNLLRTADELILCNDSVYGPIGNFNDIYREMASRKVDFWGISHNLFKKDHLQSYYLNFSRNVFLSPAFKKFFSDVGIKNNVNEVVLSYEIELTSFLAGQGFTYAPLVDTRKTYFSMGEILKKNPSPYICAGLTGGLPFIKRKALTSPFTANRDGLARMLATLGERSGALQNLLREDIERLYPDLGSQSFSLIMVAEEGDISKTLVSMLAQTWQNYEIILVIKEGMAEELQEKLPGKEHERVKLVRMPAGFSSAQARNMALEQAKGDWVAFIEPTTILEPVFLEYFALAIATKPEKDIFYGMYFKNGDYKHSHGADLDNLAKTDGTAIHPAVTAYRTDLVRRLGGFDESLSCLEDVEFLYRSIIYSAPCFIAAPLAMLGGELYGNSEGSPGALDAIRKRVDAQCGKIPLISTIITCWQHKAYIAQAIESAIMQTGNFAHEILIADDGSTDGTDQVLERFQRKYPYLLRILKTDVNMGRETNLRRAIGLANGDYLAFLDGDDRWISSNKLAGQLLFLQNHASCQLCFTACSLFDSATGSSSKPKNQDGLPTLIGPDLVLSRNNPLITCSAIMVRSCIFRPLSQESLQVMCDDLGMAMYCSNFGPLGFLDKKQVSYRISQGGAWSHMDRPAKLRNMIGRREKLLPLCRPELSELLKQDVRRLRTELYLIEGAKE